MILYKIDNYLFIINININFNDLKTFIIIKNSYFNDLFCKVIIQINYKNILITGEQGNDL